MSRIEGVDVARGLAGLIMIGGHATHAWVSIEEKASLAYGVTRLFGTLPLPAFLLLAGASVALRVDAAARRSEDAAEVRRRVTWRGLQIVLFGYGVSALYALMDGGRGLDTLLRADVLHVIGLSIAAVAWLGIRADGAGGAAPDRHRLAWTAAAVGVAVTVLCPVLTPLSLGTTGPLRYVVGLFADAPGVTRMPLVPLAAWLCAGVLLTQLLLRARARSGDRSPSGAPWQTLVAVGGMALLLAVGASSATPAGITRSDLLVWLNVIDLAARGALVLVAGALLARVLRGRARTVLLQMGRGSLVAYVFHIPFCYGALGRPLVGRLTVFEACTAAVVLAAASWGAVVARDALRARWTARAAARPRAA